MHPIFFPSRSPPSPLTRTHQTCAFLRSPHTSPKVASCASELAARPPTAQAAASGTSPSARHQQQPGTSCGAGPLRPRGGAQGHGGAALSALRRPLLPARPGPRFSSQADPAPLGAQLQEFSTRRAGADPGLSGISAKVKGTSAGTGAASFRAPLPPRGPHLAPGCRAAGARSEKCSCA